MELISKIKNIFNKTPEFDYIAYNNQLEKSYKNTLIII